MSFAGAVQFRDRSDGVGAAAAVSHWVAQSAAVSTVRAIDVGWFASFSITGAPASNATFVERRDGLVIGDVPAGWCPDARVGVGTHLPKEEFALALWDQRRRALSLFRDHFGARALYYVSEPGVWVAFASMPEPLLAIPGVRGRIDVEALPSQLVPRIEGPPDSTLFERLRRVPAAHIVEIAAGAVETRRWWALSGRPRRSPDPAVPAELRVLLDDAVGRRIVGAAHVGSHLSGGLDSSIVTALAHRATDPDVTLEVFSVRKRDEQRGPVDPLEAELADALASGLDRATLHVLRSDKANLPYYLYQQAYLDRPLPDLVHKLGPEDRVMKLAASLGVDVLLTGWGGDEMVSARAKGVTLTMLAERRWDLLRNERLLDPRTILGPLRSALVGARPMDAAQRDALLSVFRPGPAADAVNAGLLGRVRLEPARRRRRRRVGQIGVAMELFDWLGQRYGVPTRHPLQDRAVLEFCDEMPVEWIAAAGQARRAVKAAAGDLVPSAAVARVKRPLVASPRNEAWRNRYTAASRAALAALAASDTWLHDHLLLERLVELVKDEANRPAAQLAGQALAVARAVDAPGVTAVGRERDTVVRVQVSGR